MRYKNCSRAYRLFLFLLLFLIVDISLGQSKSITMTVKVFITQMSTETAKTDLIIIDENNKSFIKTLPQIFNETEQFEKLVQEEINKITLKGFKLVNSTLFQYGAMQKYYIITRYIFTEHKD